MGRTLLELAEELAEVGHHLAHLYSRREMAVREVFADPTYGPALIGGGAVKVGGWTVKGKRYAPEKVSENDRRVYPSVGGFIVKLSVKPDEATSDRIKHQQPSDHGAAQSRTHPAAGGQADREPGAGPGGDSGMGGA